MTLQYHDNADNLVARDLYDFLAEAGITDQAFDATCGWPKGATRELLEKLRPPTNEEILEICIRNGTPLSRYVGTRLSDGFGKDKAPNPRRCTAENPCCEYRLLEHAHMLNQTDTGCPRNCVCHQ